MRGSPSSLARRKGEGGLGGIVGLGRTGLVEARRGQQLRPAGCGRRSASTGLDPASPRGASSSHSGSRDQTSRPASRDVAADQLAAQRRRSPPAPRPSRRAPGSRPGPGLLAPDGTGLRPARAAGPPPPWRRAAACASAPLRLGQAQRQGQARGAGGARSGRAARRRRAPARRRCAGCAAGAWRPSRRAVRLAWATRTGAVSNRSRAAGGRSGWAPCPSATAQRGPGRTTSAGARVRAGGVVVTRGV